MANVTNRKEAKREERLKQRGVCWCPFISDGLEPFFNVEKHLQIVWNPFFSSFCFQSRMWEYLMCVYLTLKRKKNVSCVGRQYFVVGSVSMRLSKLLLVNIYEPQKKQLEPPT
jgi:hypothetical protein